MKFLGLTISFLILFTSCSETNKETFGLNSFPKDWVKLTYKDGKLVFYNSCDAGNMLLTIAQNKNGFELLLHGEQEDYNFKILDVSRINDTTFLKGKWKDSDEKQDFKFFWTNKDKGVVRFIATYPNGFISDHLFVARQKQKNFEKHYQPCQECWGEECDELESDEEKNILKNFL